MKSEAWKQQKRHERNGVNSGNKIIEQIKLLQARKKMKAKIRIATLKK